MSWGVLYSFFFILMGCCLNFLFVSVIPCFLRVLCYFPTLGGGGGGKGPTKMGEGGTLFLFRKTILSHCILHFDVHVCYVAV